MFSKQLDLPKLPFNYEAFEHASKSPLKIGIMTGSNILHGQNPTSLRALEIARQELRKRGHIVVDFELENIEEYMDTFKRIVLNVMVHRYKKKAIENGENLPLY